MKNKSEKTKRNIVLSIIFSVILVDQCLKIWIKTNMSIGECIPVLGNWFRLYFIENSGIAFGMETFGNEGKIISLFRIIVVSFIGYGLHLLIKRNAPTFFIISLSLVVAGALGNILDNIFYGLIFSESSYFGTVAEIFPSSGGYAPFLYGKVVVMLYFTFINVIFNIADLAISIGVFIIVLVALIRTFKKYPEKFDFNTQDDISCNIDKTEIRLPIQNNFLGYICVSSGYVLLIFSIISLFSLGLWAFLSWIILFISLYLIFFGKRLLATTTKNVFDENFKQPILYLRPFYIDNYYTRGITTLLIPVPIITEEMVFVKILQNKSTVIAIGKPGEKYSSLGALRLYVSHEYWHENVLELIEKSQFIMLVVGYTEGVIWELNTILQKIPPKKLLLYFPLNKYSLEDREKYWNLFIDAYKKYASNTIIQFPNTIGDIVFFRFDENWQPISYQINQKTTWVGRWFQWTFFGVIIKSLTNREHTKESHLLEKVLKEMPS